MQKVDYYTIERHEAFVPDGQKLIQVRIPREIQPYGADSPEYIETIVTMEIQLWIDNGEHTYIAMDERVNRLARFLLRREFAEAYEERIRLCRLVEEAECRRLDFRNLPWIVRAWRAVRGHF